MTGSLKRTRHHCIILKRQTWLKPWTLSYALQRLSSEHDMDRKQHMVLVFLLLSLQGWLHQTIRLWENKLYFVVPSPNIQGVINLLKGSLNARRHKIVVSSSSRSSSSSKSRSTCRCSSSRRSSSSSIIIVVVVVVVAEVVVEILGGGVHSQHCM